MTTKKSPLSLEERHKQDRSERLEVYKLLVEMADRVSQRRQSANSFYLSINTLIIGGSAYFGSKMTSAFATVLVSLAGILICGYWIMSIQSYRTLNQAKFSVINDIEADMIVKPYTVE
ncbi:MAG TPA: hypothetical protein VN137_10410, partial [Sphingomonas sp.]|nr:hypothetical protein [Sphingomonas sp.]